MLNEKEKFNVDLEYHEIFNGEKMVPVPEWLQPIIKIVMLRVYDKGQSVGYEAGKRVERIRHGNWLNTLKKE